MSVVSTAFQLAIVVGVLSAATSSAPLLSAQGNDAGPLLTRCVLVLLPSETIGQRQVIEAIRMAVTESNDKNTNTVHLVVKHEQTPMPQDPFALLDRTLAQMQNDCLVAVVGLTDVSLLNILGAVAGSMRMPVITTALQRRPRWNSVSYSSLLHAPPSRVHLSSVVKDLVQHFSWRRVCSVYSRDFSALPAMEELIHSVLPSNGVEVVRTIVVDSDGAGNVSQRGEDSFGAYGLEGCYVFLVGVNAPNLLPLAKAADSMGLLTGERVWIFIDFLTGPKMFPSELLSYMKGALIIQPRYAAGEKKIKEFADRLKRFNPNVYPCTESRLECITLESVFAYDAIGRVAACLQKWSSRLEESARSRTVNMQLQQNSSLPILENGELLLKLVKPSALAQTATSFSLGDFAQEESYNIFNLRPSSDRLVPVGTWTQDSLFDIAKDVPFLSDFQAVALKARSLSNVTLKVLVPLSSPFSYLLRNATQGKLRNEDFAGVAVDLFRDVASKAGFDYEFILWTKTWNEMIVAAGDKNNTYDIAIGSVTIKENRSLVCNFTRSIYQTGLRMLVLRPETGKSSPWYLMIQPFHWSVWLSLSIMILLSAVTMQHLDPDGVCTDRTGYIYFDALFFIMTVFFSVHEADVITRRWARTFLVVLQFAMLVLSVSYTANMATLLYLPDHHTKINTLTDIGRFPVAVRGSTTNWVYVKETLGFRNLVNVVSVQDAVNVLRNGEAVAYIADSPHIGKIASEHCDLAVVGKQVDTQEYGFVVRQNSRWLSQINNVLSASISSGVVSKSFERHMDHQCHKKVQTEHKKITLKSIGALFIIGVLVAVILTVLKLWIKTKKRNRPRFPMRSTSTQEVCFQGPLQRNLSIRSSTSNSPFSGLAFSSESVSRLPSSSSCQCYPTKPRTRSVSFSSTARYIM